ncbi:MAG: Thiamine biosynthesis protein-like protein [Candidatus Moranbacteria bacterium GW2011_GWA2_39_41]|nr:MAG: Thiamine biosynthesis protein-like protein [Candidatus Moranbacteria bacterium GW2011_GWA2_39_41]
MIKKIRALVLFSGGLDSTLAVKVLEKQNIEVVALSFVSYFFDDTKAKISAEKNNLNLRSVNFADIHCDVVKNPKRGYGKAMNPCIDCHLLMIREAGKIMRAEGFDFVATGEILGQRPMSQNLQSLKIIEKEAGLEGRLLRPLSAKLLDETEVEKQGLVDREQLLDISGRSRQRQLELVKELSVDYYPSPGGGCMLTEIEFGKKLKKLLQAIEKPTASDFALLQVGRIFWTGSTRIVVGRNSEENEKLKKMREKQDTLVELQDFMGPVTLVRGIVIGEIMEEAKKITASYSKHTKQMDYRKLSFLVC